MKAKKIVQLIGCILVPLIIGAISGFFTRNEIVSGSWFEYLNKPFFNPPNYVFGPVWTVLYILMGVSLFLIWRSEATTKKKALFVFGLQLFLNFWWSILFFCFHLIFVSIVDILFLWACIIWMIVLFKKIHPLAAYLQIPYFAWVSFASLLDISIWIMNR